MNQYPPSGPRRDTDEYDEEDDVGRTASSPSDPNRPGGNDRQFTYYPEERYWTDYLRIAAPVLGVIVLLGLAWFWLSHLIGGSGGAAVTPTTASSGNPAIITGSPSATSISGTPRVIVTGTTATGAGTPGTTGGKLGSGVAVVVANTGGSGVNMRDAPSTSGKVVATLADGDALTITGDSVVADGHTWWPVKTSGGKTGYVVADYLKASP